MTTKETAEALGVSESTIQRHVKELGLTENGKQTTLDERAVTIIKTKIERSGRTDLRNVEELPNVSTDLEMMALDAKVSEWKSLSQPMAWSSTERLWRTLNSWIHGNLYKKGFL